MPPQDNSAKYFIFAFCVSLCIIIASYVGDAVIGYKQRQQFEKVTEWLGENGLLEYKDVFYEKGKLCLNCHHEKFIDCHFRGTLQAKPSILTSLPSFPLFSCQLFHKKL